MKEIKGKHVECIYMVRTGLEKSLKIETLWDILEKSLNFPKKPLNNFESSLNKNNLRFLKKCFAQRNG